MMRRTLISVCGITVIVLCALAGALFVSIQIQQHLLRHRAGELFDDVRTLQLHTGNFADLERLQARWGAHAYYDGTCTQQSCHYVITLDDPAFDRTFVQHKEVPDKVLRLYERLGGRTTEAYASLELNSDHIWNESFRLTTFSTPDDSSKDFNTALIAVVRSSAHLFFMRYDQGSFNDLKRGYYVGPNGFCTGCAMGEVHMTAQTNPTDIQRLSTLNFDCITRRVPCRTQSDIMPEAWKEYHESDDLADHDHNYCNAPIALFAREADNVLTFEILRIDRVPPDAYAADNDGLVTIRVLERLKNAVSQPPQSTHRFEVLPEMLFPPTTRDSRQVDLAVGQHYILISHNPTPDTTGLVNEGAPTFVDDYPCSILPLTPENLQSVREGIAMDASAVVWK